MVFLRVLNDLKSALHHRNIQWDEATMSKEQTVAKLKALHGQWEQRERRLYISKSRHVHASVGEKKIKLQKLHR